MVMKNDFVIMAYFSDFLQKETPFYVDSKGIVFMLNRNFGNTWLQVAKYEETRKKAPFF